MLFEVYVGESRVWCSSQECVLKLLDKGARLADPMQSRELGRALEAAGEPPALEGKAGTPPPQG